MGGVRRTEGLILTAQKLMKSFQPLSTETAVTSVSPLLLTQHPVRLRDTAGEKENTIYRIR